MRIHELQTEILATVAMLLLTVWNCGCGSMNRVTPGAIDAKAMEADIRGKIAEAVPNKTFAVEVEVSENGVVTLSGRILPSDLQVIKIAAMSVNGVRLVRFANVIYDTEPFPVLPWPPPRASAVLEIPRTNFESLRSGVRVNLRQVAAQLREAAAEAGFPNAGLFSTPGGFALVTDIEQTDARGNPQAGSERWTLQLSTSSFSLRSYLDALVFGRTGYYRVIVIVVTSVALNMQTPKATADVVNLTKAGGLLLPNEIGTVEFSADHHAWALVYEFAKPDNTSEPVLVMPARIPAKEHLYRSRILPALERKRVDH